jgi:coenzyme F420-reducing hydrogenase alpha subunit
MTETRIIQVKALSRVEGEGGLFVKLQAGRVEQVELRIYEPPRFFEAFLRGRHLEEVPDIVARICGICPVAYQMSAVHALEQALGMQISPELRRLRRLLYCGEWIESHALHMHLLHAPDFLAAPSGIHLARQYREEVQRGLTLKKHGNRLLEVLGGRAIHPINVTIGGFHKLPRREELAALIPDFAWCVQAAEAATRWVASFSFPEFAPDYDFVALQHPEEYPFNAGDVACSDGTRSSVDSFEQAFIETQVPHSTALHCTRVGQEKPYFVGPLARINLNYERLSERVRRLAEEIGFTIPCRNPFRSIVARGLELVQVFEEALQILQSYQPVQAKVAYELVAGTGWAATEAPRGLLYHRYRVDDQGLLQEAKIIPPTSQNQSQMEQDLRDWLPRVIHEEETHIAASCEAVLRNYDPCISCSTHFLQLKLERS